MSTPGSNRFFVLLIVFLLFTGFSTATETKNVKEYQMFSLGKREKAQYKPETGEPVTFQIEDYQKNFGTLDEPFITIQSSETGETRKLTGYRDLKERLGAYHDTSGILEKDGEYSFIINCGSRKGYGELPKTMVVVEEEPNTMNDYPASTISSEVYDFCGRINNKPEALATKAVQDVDLTSGSGVIYLEDVSPWDFRTYSVKGYNETEYKINVHTSDGEETFKIDVEKHLGGMGAGTMLEYSGKKLTIQKGESRFLSDNLLLTRKGDYRYVIEESDSLPSRRTIVRSYNSCSGYSTYEGKCDGSYFDSFKSKDGLISIKTVRKEPEITPYTNGENRVEEQSVSFYADGRKLFELEDNQNCDQLFQKKSYRDAVFVVTRDLCDYEKTQAGGDSYGGEWTPHYNRYRPAKFTVLQKKDINEEKIGQKGSSLDHLNLFRGVKTQYGEFFVTEIHDRKATIFDSKKNEFIELKQGGTTKIRDLGDSYAKLKLSSLGDRYAGLDIEKEKKPDASIEFGRSKYREHETIRINFRASQPGKYRLELEGAGISRKVSFGEEDSSDTVDLKATNNGTLKASLIAPGSWWNPLATDKEIDSASIEVKRLRQVDWNEEIKLQEVDGKVKLPNGITVEKVSFGSPQGAAVEKAIKIRTSQGLHEVRKGESTDKAARPTQEFVMHYCPGDTVNGYQVFTPADETDTDKVCGTKDEKNSGNSIKILRRGPDRDLPDAYAINNPRVASNQYVDFALEGWVVSAGVDVKNQLMDKTLQLEPVMKINGEPVNNKGFMKTFSTYDDFTDGMRLKPGETKTIALHSEGGKIAEALGDGRKKFTLDVNGRTLDLGSVTVTDADYMVRSMDGSLSRGEEKSVSFTGKGKASIPEDIPRPKVVVGTADREKIFATVGEKRSYGSKFYTGEASVKIPAEADTKIVAVALNSNRDVEELFRSGKGYEKVVLGNEGSGGGDEKKEGKVQISTPEDPTKGSSSRAVVEVPDSVEKKYRILVKDPEGKKIFNSKFSRNKTSIKFKTSRTGKYTIQVYPTGTLKNIVSMISGPLAEKSFRVHKPELVDWKQFCKENGYKTEKVQDQIKCIKKDIVPEYFQDSVGDNPEVAESLCSDLLDYRYSRENRKCVPK